LEQVKKPFNAVMMVIALISLLVALFIWYLSQQVAQISYKIIQIPVVSSEGLNTTSPTSPFRVVDPQGAEIRTNVYAADITVWNSGDIDLGAEKIRRPLTISMSGDARIFDRGINRASDTVLDLNVSAISSNGTEIRWRYLDPNAGFRVRIIYGSNEKQALSINGNILGVLEFSDIDKYARRWQWYLKIAVICIVALILLILTLAVPARLTERLQEGGWAQTYQRQFLVFIFVYFLSFGVSTLILFALIKLFAVLPPEAPSNLG
jgi:hypothetical protein